MKNPHAVALGKIKSPRKAESSRQNGKLGGRPQDRWYSKAAREHKLADKACGRSWVCACACCRAARAHNA